MQRTNIIGLAADAIDILGRESYRRNQIWRWIYDQGAKSFDDMANLPKDYRAQLAEKYGISYGTEVSMLKSRDGTRKWLMEYDDKNRVECVLIPESERRTLCVSSQVGCSLACSFCHTGTQKLKRNLTQAEIVGQVMHAMSHGGDFPLRHATPRSVTNIVFMGQGEPLYNFKNVAGAIEILTSSEGLQFSPKRITVSTSGVAPLIPKLADLGVTLAISLHATNDRLRDMLVPINKTYPLEFLHHACREFLAKAKREYEYDGKDAMGEVTMRPRARITFEYVMLDGVNDSTEEAGKLARWVHRIGSRSLVNLIPFNRWPGSVYRSSSQQQMDRFRDVLEREGIDTTLRTPRGNDILAACGQLKSSDENKTQRQTKDVKDIFLTL